ncbi:uncharacterized protein LOC144360576, partial [Saccoglossus kowalevskii]
NPSQKKDSIIAQTKPPAVIDLCTEDDDDFKSTVKKFRTPTQRKKKTQKGVVYDDLDDDQDELSSSPATWQMEINNACNILSSMADQAVKNGGMPVCTCSCAESVSKDIDGPPDMEERPPTI